MGVRKEVEKDGRKEERKHKELGFFFLSCLSVVSQLPCCSGIHCSGICVDCSVSRIGACSEKLTLQKKKVPRQTENTANEVAALVSHAVSLVNILIIFFL